jgi:prepilin-type N-terminal cleavage/methylation domain-containing protein
MLKKIRKNKKGFTLAELLIVVAIIGVLVAISIPIFTSQLEKAREATDAANIRSLYAEVQTAALTGEKGKEDNANVTVDEDGNVTGTYVCTQKKPDWQDSSIKNIGGVDVSGLKVGDSVTVTVKYTASTGKTDITAGN